MWLTPSSLASLRVLQWVEPALVAGVHPRDAAFEKASPPAADVSTTAAKSLLFRSQWYKTLGGESERHDLAPRRRDVTKLATGMTSTDEPGTYVPGELGIRHEDTLVVTEGDCENLAPKGSGTPEEPAAVYPTAGLTGRSLASTFVDTCSPSGSRVEPWGT
jgi:hypothetical protein